MTCWHFVNGIYNNIVSNDDNCWSAVSCSRISPGQTDLLGDVMSKMNPRQPMFHCQTSIWSALTVHSVIINIVTDVKNCPFIACCSWGPQSNKIRIEKVTILVKMEGSLTISFGSSLGQDVPKICSTNTFQCCFPTKVASLRQSLRHEPLRYETKMITPGNATSSEQLQLVVGADDLLEKCTEDILYT